MQQATETAKVDAKVDPMARYARYKEVIPIESLLGATVMVVGVGAVGRQAALMLSAMGVGKVEVVDFDDVGPENMGAQGYRPDQIGKPKVEATLVDMLHINGELRALAHNRPFSDRMEVPEYVICCVDNMDARKRIFDACFKAGSKCKVFIETRMGLDVSFVYSAYDDVTKKAWNHCWFPQSQAVRESCTTRTTIFCAAIAASMAIKQLTLYLRGEKPLFQCVYNMELMAGAPMTAEEALALPASDDDKSKDA